MRQRISYQLFWKPLDVPSADALYILDLKFEAIKVPSCYCIKGNVEEDERPFEEGVDGVG